MTGITGFELYLFVACTISLVYVLTKGVQAFSQYSEQKKLDEWKSFRDQALTETETTTDTTTS